MGGFSVFTGGRGWGAWNLTHLLLRYYDLYQRLQLVLCSPDDGCDGHPKHVEGYCSK